MLLLGLFLIFFSIPGGFGIFGGTKASIRDSPHHVAILHSGFVECSGGIISEKHILTAAHCATYETNEYRTDLLVLSGVDDVGDLRYSKTHEVSMILCHGKFSTGTWGMSDIAVLKLSSPIFFSPRRQPITLQSEKIPVYSNVTISGWGHQRPSLYRDQYLRSISMFTIPWEYCEIINFANLPINEFSFCAVTDDINDGISYGDSGGIVVYNGKAVGVAFGGVRGSLGNPAVSTRICCFFEWIQESMKRF